MADSSLYQSNESMSVLWLANFHGRIAKCIIRIRFMIQPGKWSPVFFLFIYLFFSEDISCRWERLEAVSGPPLPSNLMRHPALNQFIVNSIVITVYMVGIMRSSVRVGIQRVGWSQLNWFLASRKRMSIPSSNSAMSLYLSLSLFCLFFFVCVCVRVSFFLSMA